ncbi:MAG: chorismate mutase, partial [Bacteroidetes bacterium]|nr:chorismate mutase [Bacteroidota bacterium]
METPTKSDLNNLRLLIDDIDNALLQLFKDRMEVSKAVGEFKKAN